jgi:hypothetical protein
MKKLGVSSVSAAILTAVLSFGGGAAMASGGDGGGGGGGSSGTWPVATFPLPTNPGTIISQSSSRATVRSTDTVATVQAKLDDIYVNQKGCVSRPAVNKPKDYFCGSREIYFTFAALDPTATDASRSQTNAFLP